MKVEFVPWNWDKTDKLTNVTCVMAHTCSASMMSHAHELQNPIIFDYIIQQHAMTNICAADEIICGHSDIRSDLHSTLFYNTLTSYIFKKSCQYMTMKSFTYGGTYFYLPGRRNFP